MQIKVSGTSLYDTFKHDRMLNNDLEKKSGWFDIFFSRLQLRENYSARISIIISH